MATRKTKGRKTTTKRTYKKRTTASKATARKTTRRTPRKKSASSVSGPVKRAIRKAGAIVRAAVRAKTHNEKAARKAGRAVRGAARQTIKKNAGSSALNGVRHTRTRRNYRRR